MYAYLDIAEKKWLRLEAFVAELGLSPAQVTFCSVRAVDSSKSAENFLAEIFGYDFTGLGSYSSVLRVQEYSDLFPIIPPEKTYYVSADMLLFHLEPVDKHDIYVWVDTDGKWQSGDARPDDNEVKKASELTETLNDFSTEITVNDFNFEFTILGGGVQLIEIYAGGSEKCKVTYSSCNCIGHFKSPVPIHVNISVLNSIPEEVETDIVLQNGQKVLTADVTLGGGYKEYSAYLNELDSPFCSLLRECDKLGVSCDSGELYKQLHSYSDSGLSGTCPDGTRLDCCYPLLKCGDPLDYKTACDTPPSQPDLRPQYFISKVVSNDDSSISQKELLAEIAKIRATYPKLRYNLEDAKAYPKEWSHTDVPVSEDKE